MSLLVIGTVAFDAIETPFGKTEKIVGGSATYVAYAASYFVKPIQQVSIVGYDFSEEEMAEMKSRGIVLDGVEIVKDKKSFFKKVTSLGLKIVSKNRIDDDSYLQIYRTDYADFHSINDITDLLVNLLEEYDAELDGWETLALK